MKQPKKLTRSQINMLLHNGVDNINDWVFLREEAHSLDDRKSLAKNSGKVIYSLFQNKTSGEIKSILN